MNPRKPTRAKGLGVNDERYATLLAAQSGGCAICGRPPKTRRLHVDHDHATGAVRGLLCHRCNRALPTWVTRAWLYQAMLYLNDEPLEPPGALAEPNQRPDTETGDKEAASRDRAGSSGAAERDAGLRARAEAAEQERDELENHRADTEEFLARHLERVAVAEQDRDEALTVARNYGTQVLAERERTAVAEAALRDAQALLDSRHAER